MWKESIVSIKNTYKLAQMLIFIYIMRSHFNINWWTNTEVLAIIVSICKSLKWQCFLREVRLVITHNIPEWSNHQGFKRINLDFSSYIQQYLGENTVWFYSAQWSFLTFQTLAWTVQIYCLEKDQNTTMLISLAFFLKHNFENPDRKNRLRKAHF